MDRLRSLPHFLPVWLRAALLVLLGAGLAACGTRPAPRDAGGLPRADPGYAQWLERQSMLGAAPKLAEQVSGTDLLWRNSASAQRERTLLAAAPNWLDVNPHALPPSPRPLQALARPDLARLLTEAGFGGVFISPTGETADIWTDRGSPAPNAPAPEGENVSALHVAPSLGTEKAFAGLADALDEAGLQMGGDLPPAATGAGPDFLLQTRNVSRFDGVYAMLPVPRQDWNALPAVAEGDALPLRAAAVEDLRRRGVLPGPLWRDGLPWASPGGWAVTGEVRGADGLTRRWAYRYSGTALRPVLLWQDPSARARRIWSAAVIRHTGLQGQALAGLRLEPLLGLDTRPQGAPPQKAASPASVGLAPGLEALETLSAEVHRYGGWAMQADVLPPSLTRPALDTGVDFTRDAAVPAGAAYALLSGDAAPLAALLEMERTSGVESRRLARGMRCRREMDWRPLLDLPNGSALARRAQELAGGRPGEATVSTTLAGLAARAIGLTAAETLAPAHAAALRDAALLLLAWRVGLPGPAFFSAEDLTGLLPPTAGTGIAATPLWSSGAPAAAGKAAFGPLDRQWTQEDSLARQLAALLRLRRDARLAEGRLVRVFHGPNGCVAALSALPDGRFWLVAANFSDKRQTMACALPPGIAGGRNFSATLAPRQARHMRLGIAAAKPSAQGDTP